MNSIRAFAACTVVLSFAIVGVGCKQDEAAIKALQELTTQLETTATEQNQTLTNLSEELKTCKTELAEVTDSTAVVTEGATFEVPALGQDVNLVSLEAHKLALNDVITKQKDKIASLTTENQQCTQDLGAAKEKAEQAKARKPRKKKPKAVKVREAQGKPTTGARSRYEKR